MRSNKLNLMILIGLAGCGLEAESFRTNHQVARNSANTASVGEFASVQFSMVSDAAIARKFSPGGSRYVVECRELSIEGAGDSIMLPIGAVDCALRLKAITADDGTEFKVAEDFKSLMPGAVAKFVSGDGHALLVRILSQLHQPLLALERVEYQLADFVADDGAKFESLIRTEIVGSVESATELTVQKVVRLPSGGIVVVLRCGAGDVLGSSVEAASCSGESLASHRLAIFQDDGKVDYLSLKSRADGDYISISSLSPKFAMERAQVSERRMVATVWPNQLSPGQYFRFVISHDEKLWLRHGRFLTGPKLAGENVPGQSPTPTATPSPTPSTSPTIAPSPTPSPSTQQPGIALYGTYCAGCHGELMQSTKRGRTSVQIRAASNIPGMGFVDDLSASDLTAIQDALK